MNNLIISKIKKSEITDNVRLRDDIIVEATRIYVEREQKRIIIGQDILFTSEVILKETAGVLMRPKFNVGEQIIHHFFQSIRDVCRRCLFSLLLLVSLNQVKAQLPDVTTENIRFENAGVSLAGTIYMPRHPYAAVVLVHGSDPAPRMRVFASLLAEKGISVLTYDKRGVGESGGIYVGPEVGTNNVDPTNLTLLAEDANAAVNILYQRDKNIPVGLVGFSQAGWIIPIAANKNPLVDFMVLFSGSMVPTLEQLRFQFFTEGKPDFWESHTEAEAREHIRSDADRYQFANTDPYDALSTLSIPGLWLFGGKDVQVPVGLSIERLNTLKAQGKPYEYCLFSTLGHNTAFSDSTEPVNIAVHWIKDRKHYYTKNKASKFGLNK